MKRLLVAVSLVLIPIATGSCLRSDGAIEGEGTVHQGVGPECPTTWHVLTANGRMLWPVEDPEFQEEGLRVRFTARVKDGESICMAGTMVEMVSLRGL